MSPHVRGDPTAYLGDGHPRRGRDRQSSVLREWSSHYLDMDRNQWDLDRPGIMVDEPVLPDQRQPRGRNLPRGSQRRRYHHIGYVDQPPTADTPTWDNLWTFQCYGKEFGSDWHYELVGWNIWAVKQFRGRR